MCDSTASDPASRPCAGSRLSITSARRPASTGAFAMRVRRRPPAAAEPRQRLALCRAAGGRRPALQQPFRLRHQEGQHAVLLAIGVQRRDRPLHGAFQGRVEAVRGLDHHGRARQGRAVRLPPELQHMPGQRRQSAGHGDVEAVPPVAHPRRLAGPADAGWRGSAPAGRRCPAPATPRAHPCRAATPSRRGGRGRRWSSAPASGVGGTGAVARASGTAPPPSASCPVPAHRPRAAPRPRAASAATGRREW